LKIPKPIITKEHGAWAAAFLGNYVLTRTSRKTALSDLVAVSGLTLGAPSACYIELYRRQLATRALAPRVEAEIPLRTGKRILVELSNSVLGLPGQPPRVFTVCRDITE